MGGRGEANEWEMTTNTTVHYESTHGTSTFTHSYPDPWFFIFYFYKNSIK